MKPLQYIFTFLFLGSMLFTVFQYIPILEEEIHTSKTLSKKSGDPCNEKDTDSDSDPDGDDADDYFHGKTFNSITLYAALHIFRPSLIYDFPDSRGIKTPPPKI